MFTTKIRKKANKKNIQACTTKRQADREWHEILCYLISFKFKLNTNQFVKASRGKEKTIYLFMFHHYVISILGKKNTPLNEGMEKENKKNMYHLKLKREVNILPGFNLKQKIINMK
jgi:hypothetical protein